MSAPRRTGDLDRDRAERWGYGLVRVSAQRWVVVRASGSAVGREPGDPGWHARVLYATLTKPLHWRRAMDLVYDLDRAAMRGAAGLQTACDALRLGPDGPSWEAAL